MLDQKYLLAELVYKNETAINNYMVNTCNGRGGPVSALMCVILEAGNTNLSKASMRTPYEVERLVEARDYLLERKLIRPVPNQLVINPLFVSYEANVYS